MNGYFEYSQYYHPTHEKNFRTIWKKSLQIFGIKIAIVFVAILYSFRHVLDDNVELKCLKKTFDASNSYVLYIKNNLLDQGYLLQVQSSGYALWNAS